MSGLGIWLRRLAWLVFMVVLTLGVFTARVMIEGESELAASDAAFDRGELVPALDHARRSATLYAPGATHVERAYARLNAIALGAEAAREPKVAFLAWQAMRSAALESRHVLIPRQAELERANQNLARLEALSRGTGDAELPRNQSQALSRLSADDAPAPGWIAMLGLGFSLALVGLGLFALQGVDRAGQLRFGRARWGIVLFAIGAACWTAAAYRA